MISSTALDLPRHRERAIDAVWRVGFFPLAMERDEAESANVVEYSLRLVDQAQIYIGIISFRYGSIPEGQTASVTELEYRRAVARGIPILIFIMSDDHDVKSYNVEPDPAKIKRLNALKAELTSTFKISYYRSVDQFAFQLLESLFKLKESGKLGARPQTSSYRLTIDYDILQMPKPYIAHPYIPSRKFFGRQRELQAIDDWADSLDNTLVIDAIGGVGKSALAWEWLQTRVIDKETNEDGIVWWSFYEADSSVENLMKRTLQYITGMTSTEVGRLRTDERESLLLQELKTKRLLLVLDGLERLLVAYSRSDAARISDADVDHFERMPNSWARRFTDWHHGDFVRTLATRTASRVLITTRLLPTDLTYRHTGRLLPGVRHLNLPDLDAEDALALMQSLGVNGNPEELKLFMKRFGYHSLLLGIIAGRIVNYRPAPGDFAAWMEAEGGQFRVTELELAQRHSHILKYALEGLTAQQQTLLSQIAAFRYPVDYETLSVFNPFQSTTSGGASAQPSSEAQFDALLTELETRGLLQWERATNRYDLHPVVRNYAFEQLEDPMRTFDRIRDFFGRFPPEDVTRAQSVDDLRRTLEIYYALTGAGHYQEASDLYENRLHEALLFRLAAYPVAFEVLSSLFPSGLYHPPAVVRGATERMTDLVHVLNQLGDHENAVRMTEMVVVEQLKAASILDIIRALIQYADALANSNRLAQAQKVFAWVYQVATRRNDSTVEAITFAQILRFNVVLCDWNAVKISYDAFRGRYFGSGQLGENVDRYYAEMLVVRGLPAADRLKTLRGLAIMAKDTLAERSTLTLMARDALNHGDLSSARAYALDAITSAQRSGMHTGPYSILLARIAALEHQTDEASGLLAESALGGARNVDIAEVLQLLGRTEEAKVAARAAYQEAWADGKPYCRMDALERATAVLVSLREPLPELPPFDWQRIPQLPIESAIEQFVAAMQTPGSRWMGGIRS